MDHPTSPDHSTHGDYSAPAEESMFPALGPIATHAVPLLAAAAIGISGFGFAMHEHHKAQTLQTQDAQMTAQLAATRSQMDALTAKVNALTAPPAPAPELQASDKPSPATRAHGAAAPRRRVVSHRGPSPSDRRFKKLQDQLDAQGKQIDAARADINGTRTDLASARTELGGAIAKTHGELVNLQRKGERNYYEFDIVKSKQFSREGPLSMKLRKANEKHQYADLTLIVEDRDLTEKHVNLYQPVQFYRPDSPLPMEIVINQITKNHIHGYVSAPKYRQSELAAMAAQDDSGPVQVPGPSNNQAASAQPAQRQRLQLPSDTVPQ